MNFALNKARSHSIKPDKSPLDATTTARTALPPTSNFLLNRHKILRKQDEAAGKLQTGEASVKPAAAAPESDSARDEKNISTLNVVINPKFDEPIESDRPPTGRPDLLPKPVIKPAEPPSPSESPTKKGRGILRVASLRGIRSRTPSPKKKEEFLEESVMYTKLKPAPPEPPLSGNRQHLLRRRPAENVTRVEVSAPQLVSTTAGGATTIQIGGPRAPSPAPQRTTVIPASVQVPSKVNVIVEPPPSEHVPVVQRSVPVVVPVQRPLGHAGDEQTITPVYSHLSTARALLRTSVTKTTQNESSAASISSYIQPQIRPMPPRKPLRRNEITETLLEVLPQHPPRPHATEPAPSAVTSSAHKETTIHIQQTASNLRPTGTRLQPKPPVQREQDVRSPSVGGNMTFDDDLDNISSSHVDYEHSSADETTEELVKRSLVKASHRSGRGTIGDIQEEGGTLVRTEESHTKPNPDQVKQPPVNFKCNYPLSTPYKPAYTSADESDSSRGGGRVSYIASTRPSRIVEPRKDQTALTPAVAVNDQNNAGRRKYAERRQVLRNFEDALQRKRLTSKTSASSIDSADSNDNDSLPEGFGQRSQGMVQGGYGGRMTGGNVYDRQRTTTTTRSRYYVPSDDAASDSIGIPEPLPEYEYPNRIQGRTIQEEQQIRETVRLRAGSSSSTSSLDRSPERRYAAAQHGQQHERTHFSRHFEISPEELTTARSLIHHRLPPTYSEPPPPVARPLRNPSQSPARRPPHLPPPSPMHVGPVVHHSDGETRYYPEKPKKKMGIVRRLSELVRGERKSLKRGESPPTVVRNASNSSIEQMEQRHTEPIPAAGTLSVRRQSPVRRYQDRPLRQTAVPLSGSVERGESFTRPAAMAKNNPYRTSGNFSDATAASFAYAPVEPSPPVYAFPDKLQKRQNLRHRSMSEHDLNQPPMDSRSTFQYEDPHPVKPSKSIESLTESVHKEKYRGPLIVTQRPYEEFNQRTTKTNLIPYGKQEGFNAPVRNTARVRSPRSSMYDKVGQQYSSTPVLAPAAGMYPVMAPPLKPPRRYDMDSIARSTDRDSDLQSSLEDRIRLPAERPLERSRPELDLRAAATDRSDLYSEPLSTTMDEALRSRSPIREPYPTRPEKHVAEVKRAPSNAQRNAEMAAMYSRTRMAANDLTNRRYHSAAGGIDQAPVERGRRMIPRESRPVDRGMVGSGDRQYKSAYRLEMQSPVAPGPGGVVAERSRFFNNLPAGRKEYAVRR